MTRLARISCLELARVRFPDGRVTSGAGQDYLRSLDRVFRPDGFRAKVESGPDGIRVLSLDESTCYNVPGNAARAVVRAYLELSE